MGYPICRKCRKEMIEPVETEFLSTMDGVQRIYKCDCGEKCQAVYNFEEVIPSDIFWEDSFDGDDK